MNTVAASSDTYGEGDGRFTHSMSFSENKTAPSIITYQLGDEAETISHTGEKDISLVFESESTNPRERLSAAMEKLGISGLYQKIFDDSLKIEKKGTRTILHNKIGGAIVLDTDRSLISENERLLVPSINEWITNKSVLLMRSDRHLGNVKEEDIHDLITLLLQTSPEMSEELQHIAYEFGLILVSFLHSGYLKKETEEGTGEKVLSPIMKELSESLDALFPGEKIFDTLFTDIEYVDSNARENMVTIWKKKNDLQKQIER